MTTTEFNSVGTLRLDANFELFLINAIQNPT